MKCLCECFHPQRPRSHVEVDSQRWTVDSRNDAPSFFLGRIRTVPTAVSPTISSRVGFVPSEKPKQAVAERSTSAAGAAAMAHTRTWLWTSLLAVAWLDTMRGCPTDAFVDGLPGWDQLMPEGERLPNTLFGGNTWYLQLAMPSATYPSENNFCVREVWSITTPFGLRSRMLASIRRSYNEGSIDGELVTSSRTEFELHGLGEEQADPTGPQMGMGLRGWPTSLLVPVYIVDANVVDVGESEQWVVLSGTPDQQGREGCRPNSALSGGGYAVFTKVPKPSTQLLRSIGTKLNDRGMDTSVLEEIPQEGCEYPR